MLSWSYRQVAEEVLTGTHDLVRAAALVARLGEAGRHCAACLRVVARQVSLRTERSGAKLAKPDSLLPRNAGQLTFWNWN